MTAQLPLFTLPEIKPDPVQQAQIDLEPYRARANHAGYKFVHVWAGKQDKDTTLAVYRLLAVINKDSKKIFPQLLQRWIKELQA